MSFAGVSVVADGELLQPSAESTMIYSGTASGSGYHHLLVVEGYSLLKNTPNGVCINGRSFRAGGYRWSLKFYPNGNPSKNDGFVSVCLSLDQDDVAQPVKVHLQFSFMDEVDKQQPTHIRAIKTVDFSTGHTEWGRLRFIKREHLEKSKHLRDDCFTIRCDFTIAEATAPPLIEVPPSNICEHLNHLFTTKVGTDVTFEVGTEMLVAHRCVLAARSPMFMAELFGPMKEGTTTGAIHIEDMEPSVFNALLGFIYTDSMPKMEVEAGEEDGAEVNWLRHLLAAADRYDLQRLKSMCEERLLKHIDVHSAMAILHVAAQHHCHALKESCLEFLKVQSATDLQVVMTTSDWEHIALTNLSVVNELIVKLALKA